MKKFLASILFIVFLVTGCGTSNEEGTENSNGNASNNETANQENIELPQATTEVGEKERLVEMETSMGNIKIKLFPEQAPKAVENFITHSEEGYYEGVIFHRVINDFMIQGGDPDGTGMGGESIYGKPFEDEFSNQLYNFRGALSMANSGADTNGSQFFIVQNKTLDPGLVDQMKQAGYNDKVIKQYEDGGTPWLDQAHTVFGQVIEGMDVVDKIATTSVGEGDKPEEDVVIKKITVLK
ncbi:peptidylprolyl isomerase [Robertmurraya korlensis]|uniref:peptidylprolyl isomerase n=1 Tax=Robertmurraya korlensis TaxID=519977 RepID=UPI00203F36BC|nr:peptidylprolyl isomerase [Robertmurraya korlensis]MCM3600571.1 peptidylprolyl isomerase [Robertmurraya korlensis]